MEGPLAIEGRHPDIIEEGPSLALFLTDDFLKKFEHGVENYRRWNVACYKLTRPTHWINHNGKYSLQGPGAEALCNPLGISFDRPEVHREEVTDPAGDFYIWWCEGYVESKTLGRRGWYVGYCDSRDQFFQARPGWKPQTGSGDVKKASMTNWIVNAVSRIAGLRDPDPKTLTDAGIGLGDIPSVDYSGRRSPEQDSALISEAQRKRLWAICKSHNASEESVKTHFGIASFTDVKRGDYDRICKWAEEGGKSESPAAPPDPAAKDEGKESPPPPAGDVSPEEAARIGINELLESRGFSTAWLTARVQKLFRGSGPPVKFEDLSLLQLGGLRANIVSEEKR